MWRELRSVNYCYRDIQPPQICRLPWVWGRSKTGMVIATISRNTPTGVRKTGRQPEWPLPVWKHPTGVGKTRRPLPGLECAQKHPHGRGEDNTGSNPAGGLLETPPRAWGRPGEHQASGAVCGNTPTGVGKTIRSSASRRPARKHPHGHGEDCKVHANDPGCQETPPRAWGIHRRALAPCKVRQKHPHGRGEDQRLFRPVRGSRRNTPTGVGKTPSACRSRGRRWKHPHGRGEDRPQP